MLDIRRFLSYEQILTVTGMLNLTSRLENVRIKPIDVKGRYMLGLFIVNEVSCLLNEESNACAATLGCHWGYGEDGIDICSKFLWWKKKVPNI